MRARVPAFVGVHPPVVEEIQRSLAILDVEHLVGEPAVVEVAHRQLGMVRVVLDQQDA